MGVHKDTDQTIAFGDSKIVNGLHIHSKEFDDEFYYNGNDLGNHYTSEGTFFRLWAPTAVQAEVVLYKTWDGDALEYIPMTRSEKGTWITEVEKDLLGYFYTYRVLINHQWNEAVDPYAKAVGVNGDRGAIIDLSLTNPDNWTNQRPPFENAVDAIIYELHVHDASIHPESGMNYKGKYLALTETGTTGPNGISTGLDHIKKLGVTHVQFLPLYDFATVDETKLDEPQYNWGYDPKNYQVPEGWYSTNPFDPMTRIKEMKQMIQTLHDNGIRVIMDVVFNHVYNPLTMSFGKLVPGYYFREWENGELSNGSGCGNDTASERKMMRKYMIDTVKYFAEEYHIDGFRFDLMGLHDVETMNQIRATLDEIDPTILIIGEGWDLHTNLPSELKASQHNAHKMDRIAHFNDRIRDAIKGGVYNVHDRGFINGNDWIVDEVKKGIAGAIPYNDFLQSFAQQPSQTVTYVEAHDDLTLWDKIKITNPDDDEDTLKKMHLLATAIVLTSQGISFIHAGQEFMRTKGGERNSYRSPSTVNQLDWQRCADHYDMVEQIQQLIAIRREHPAFRLRSAEEIRKHLHFEHSSDRSVAYTLRNHANGDPAKNLFVAHNGNHFSKEYVLPGRVEWNVLYGQSHIEQRFENQENHQVLKISPFGSIILFTHDDL